MNSCDCALSVQVGSGSVGVSGCLTEMHTRIQRMVSSGLRSLDPEESQVLLMLYRDGRSRDETARFLGRGIEEVLCLELRARRSLSSFLSRA